MKQNRLIRYTIWGILIICPWILTSCDMFHEDLPECRLFVKFKYDYNMLFTDAFHTQVDKVELYVFDKDGKFLFSQVEEGEALATGNYQMEVKLPIGEYQFLAWAGARDSYDIYTPRGENDFTGTSHQTETIDLIKDTNKIRFVFQGYSDSYIRATSGDNWNVNMNDYEYEIIESNGHLAYDNSLLEDDVLSFRPYYMEQKSSSAAAVELNTMRLMEDRPTRFVVTEKSTGKKVFNINLTDFLALTSMEGNNMDVQEYLDRQDRYKIIFFFADNTWNAVQVNINGWTWYLQSEGI